MRRSDPDAGNDRPNRRQSIEPVLVSRQALSARRVPDADYWLREDTLVEPPIHRATPQPQPAPVVVDAEVPVVRPQRRGRTVLLIVAALLVPGLVVLAEMQPVVRERLSGMAAALRERMAPSSTAAPIAEAEPVPALARIAIEPAPLAPTPVPDPPPPAASRPEPPAPLAAEPQAVIAPASVPERSAEPVLPPPEPAAPTVAAVTPPALPVPAATPPAQPAVVPQQAEAPRPAPRVVPLPPRAAPPPRVSRDTAEAEPVFQPFDPPASRRDNAAEREAAGKAVPRNARCALLIRTAQLGIGLEITDLAYLRRVCAPD